MNDLFINFSLAYVVKLLFDFRISLLEHIKGNPEAGCHYSLFGRPHHRDLTRRMSRIVRESRDPSTVPHGFTQAEPVEQVMKVITSFDTKRKRSACSHFLHIGAIYLLEMEHSRGFSAFKHDGRY